VACIHIHHSFKNEVSKIVKCIDQQLNHLRCYRIWKGRTVLWTHDTLYFAHGEVMVDSIPLHEIMSIEEMNEDLELSQSLQSPSIRPFISISTLERKNSTLDQGKDKTADTEQKKLTGHRKCIIQLKTVPEGFNLGRIYYLKANVDTPDRLIITHLSEARIKAKGIAERKSKFQKSQDMMRKVQESLVFQIIVAMLILLVRSLSVSWG
jgi:hypothetical protein